VVAHQFGHCYAGDTRLGPWVCRARLNMALVLARLGRDSAVLSFLSRWAAVGVARLAMLGGLSLWWKLFNRVTQHISRKQEFRCDELACLLAGSESLEKGLCSLCGATTLDFLLYWIVYVALLVTSGYRPQVTDGYGRFVKAPERAAAMSALLKQRLASNAPSAMDSDPPLSARIERARRLAIPTVAEDSRPAVALFEDLPALEEQLLSKLMPAIKPSELKPLDWDAAGSEVYVPLWREQFATVAPALNGVTTRTLPGDVSKLMEIARRIPDPPGTLLTREQRAINAAHLIGRGLLLTLIEHAGNSTCNPGSPTSRAERGPG